jgi:Uma2 family endonuclease
VVTTISREVQEQVREIVFLLMKRPITEEIAMQVEAIEGFEHLEIVNGEWVGFEKDEYMAGEEHGWIETTIIHALADWALKNKAGRVYSGDTDFVLDGTSDDIRKSRKPDVAFVKNSRVKPSKGYVYLAPDLVVEIISPTERPGAIREKLNEYLEYGVKQVWQVFPDNQQIVVNYPDGSARTYGIGDTISGGELLPGFELAVATVFEGWDN